MTKHKTDKLNSLSGLLGASPDGSATPKNSTSHDPVELAEGQTLCGDLDICINAEGLWFYHGSPIGRKELVKLFSSVLSRDQDGRYWLITPAEKGEIVVEDVPFQAVEMAVTGENETQILTFRTNIDEIVIANKAHPIRIETDPETDEPSPYIMIRDGLEARLTRSVFYQLVDLGVEKAQEPDKYNVKYNDLSNENQIFGVWSSEQFFQIGTLTGSD
jgi:uncharacterized protein